MNVRVCVRMCVLLENDAIGDEIYADKCKVASTNILESNPSILPIQHVLIYTHTWRARNRVIACRGSQHGIACESKTVENV